MTPTQRARKNILLISAARMVIGAGLVALGAWLSVRLSQATASGSNQVVIVFTGLMLVGAITIAYGFAGFVGALVHWIFVGNSEALSHQTSQHNRKLFEFAMAAILKECPPFDDRRLKILARFYSKVDGFNIGWRQLKQHVLDKAPDTNVIFELISRSAPHASPAGRRLAYKAAALAQFSDRSTNCSGILNVVGDSIGISAAEKHEIDLWAQKEVGR